MKQEFMLSTKTENGLEVFSVLLNGVPFIGGILSGTLGLINAKLANDRLEQLLQKINESKISLQEAVKSDNFISHTVSIMNCVARTRRKNRPLCKLIN